MTFSPALKWKLSAKETPGKMTPELSLPPTPKSHKEQPTNQLCIGYSNESNRLKKTCQIDSCHVLTEHQIIIFEFFSYKGP